MTETEIAEWAKKLTKRFDNVKIVGSQGEWSGDARQGFMFNPKPRSVQEETPVTPTGACCFNDGTCAVETAAQCALDGGTYQGDSTTCVPNPCGVVCLCESVTLEVEYSYVCEGVPGSDSWSGTGDLSCNLGQFCAFGTTSGAYVCILRGFAGHKFVLIAPGCSGLTPMFIPIETDDPSGTYSWSQSDGTNFQIFNVTVSCPTGDCEPCPASWNLNVTAAGTIGFCGPDNNPHITTFNCSKSLVISSDYNPPFCVGVEVTPNEETDCVTCDYPNADSFWEGGTFGVDCGFNVEGQYLVQILWHFFCKSPDCGGSSCGDTEAIALFTFSPVLPHSDTQTNSGTKTCPGGSVSWSYTVDITLS